MQLGISPGPKILFSDTKCAVGNSECVIRIYLMCSSILKTVATSCHILRLKCIKFDIGWDSAPDPALDELTALPETPSWI